MNAPLYTLQELADLVADPLSSPEVRRLAIKCAFCMGAKEGGERVAKTALDTLEKVDFGTGSAYEHAVTS